MPPRVFRLNDKESGGGCMAASRRWRRTQRRFGFNERINDAFTKRAKGEGRGGTEQKDGKEGESECRVRQCRLALDGASRQCFPLPPHYVAEHFLRKFRGLLELNPHL